MLITKEKLNLAKYVKSSNSQYALDSLFFDKNKTVVSNGHYLIQVEDTLSPQEDFPDIKGMGQGDYIPDKVLVTVKTATRVSKNIPASEDTPTLQNAKMEVDTDGNVRFGLTDLESSMVITQRKVKGHYPNIDDVIPTNTPQSAVKIDIQYLQKIVNAMGEFSKTGTVNVSLHGPNGPMVCQRKKDDVVMTTLIMPTNKS